MTRFAGSELRRLVAAAVAAEGLRAFARRSGVGVGVVRSVLDGRDPYLSSALTLNDALGVKLRFDPPKGIEAEQSKRAITLLPEAFERELETQLHSSDGNSNAEPIGGIPANNLAAFAAIPLYAATLAAGGGSLNEDEAVIGQLAFRRDWLRRIGVAPASAVLARARGESMSPTIRDGDMLLIDRARASPPDKLRAPKDTRPPYIYALLDPDGAARVKRLELVSPGFLAILSDNHEHPPETRPARDVSIIGKVVWWGRTVKD